MLSLRSFTLLALAGTGFALPSRRSWGYSSKRSAGSPLTDVDILNYALTLEHLEDKFYREGLANFTAQDFATAGFDATFYANLKEISSDETTHVEFLTTALSSIGAAPVEECTYAFGITTVAAFVATASVLEGVGVSAYLGAAASIANKAYLTAAGSILTIEARHSSYLRAALKEIPFPQPFDDPLSLNEVYTLAAPFIVSCPTDNPKIPLSAFPTFAVSSADTVVRTGSTLNLVTDGYVLSATDPTAMLYAAFITVTGPIWATLTSAGDGMNFHVVVPAGVAGQSYLVLTNCNDTMVTDSTVVAGPALVEIS